MRRLLFLASAMIFFDVAFFAAIAPLLPEYVDELGLTKAQAGVLSAAYAAGTLLASLPAGFVASRIGPRRTVIYGLLLLGASSLIFGLVEEINLLDAARFTQGIAGALIWAGALTWLITSSPDEARGSVIGTALGTAVAGALLGPALGAVAASIGTELVFGSVMIVTTALALAASRLPETAAPEQQALREVGAAMLSRPILDAAAFVAVPSLMFGAIEVLVPLRIDALGGGHGVIAGGFIAGAALEAVLAPMAGRFSDRVGRRSPYVTGLSVCAVAMVVVALAQTLGGVLAALVLTSLGAGLCFAPALTLLSDVADSSNLHQGFAAGLSNMAWASGQVAGGVGGGVVATVTGNAVPCIAIAVLLLVTVAYAFRALEPSASPQPAGG
jgi:MFS family permease